MHREHAIEKVNRYTLDELASWRDHVLFCLAWHRKDENQFEVDDCEFLLRQIDDRMALLKGKSRF